MDKIDQYRQIIRDLLQPLTKRQYVDAEITNEAVFDEKNDHYLIMSIGWQGRSKRIHGCLVHLDIINGKVWIQRDGTEDGIGYELEAAGIPKTDIVPAFHPENVTTYRLRRCLRRSTMLSPEEFKKQWKKLDTKHRLVTIPHSVLKTINIPEDAKQFLAEAGVPKDDVLGTPVNVRLPKLPNSFPGTEVLPVSYERYRAFGDVGYMNYVCIDEAANGRIVSVCPSRTPLCDQALSPEEYEVWLAEHMPSDDEYVEPKMQFWNSSIQQFAACLLLVWKYCDIVETKEVWSNDTLRKKYADIWEAEVRQIDPPALTEKWTWPPEWALRIDHIRSGRVM